MKLRRLIAGVVMILLSSLSIETVWAETSEPVSVVLSRSTNPADAGKSSIIVTITNHGTVPVWLSKSHLPFGTGPLSSNLFDVRSLENQTQTYQGYLVKTIGANADQFIQLKPSESMSGKVEMRRSYTFDTQVDNRFLVKMNLPLGMVPEGYELDDKAPGYATDPNRMRFVESNQLQITVDYSVPLDPTDTSTPARHAPTLNDKPAATLNFSQPMGSKRGTCDASQIAALVAALQVTKTLSDNSYSYVNMD